MFFNRPYYMGDNFMLFEEPFPIGRKILYHDVETTGTDAKRNGIVQYAGLIEIDGKIVHEFDYKMDIFPYDEINIQAINVHGFTTDQIHKFESPLSIHSKIQQDFGKFIDPFKKGKTFADKFYPAGYNVGFDNDFLNEWFRKCGDGYFGSWINWHSIDPRPYLHVMELQGKIQLINYKLETICHALGIPIDAHDALSDIKATRQVIHEVIPGFKS